MKQQTFCYFISFKKEVKTLKTEFMTWLYTCVPLNSNLLDFLMLFEDNFLGAWVFILGKTYKIPGSETRFKLGVIQQLRGPDFIIFWPLTFDLEWTIVNILHTTPTNHWFTWPIVDFLMTHNLPSISCPRRYWMTPWRKPELWLIVCGKHTPGPLESRGLIEKGSKFQFLLACWCPIVVLKAMFPLLYVSFIPRGRSCIVVAL